MPAIDFKKQILPHLVALVIFLLITLIFFSPLFFEGKTLRQGDILQGRGTTKVLTDYRESHDDQALWVPSMFAGMPAYLVAVNYGGDTVLGVFQDIFSFWLPRPSSIFFKSMICFYILLLAFRVRPYLAIAGAIAYGLSTFGVISLEAGHNWKVEAMSVMPLVLAGIHTTVRRHYLWGFALTSLGLALEIDSNHPQITYYLLLLVIFYGISALVFAIREQQLKPFLTSAVVLVVAALLAVGANLGRLWTTAEYSAYSTRGSSELTAAPTLVSETDAVNADRDYVFQWSTRKLEAFTLLIPNFFGGGAQDVGMESELGEALAANGVPRPQVRQYTENAPTYWGGKPFTSGPVYVGAIICFLFVLGCFIVDKRHRYWLIGITVFSIILSWGRFFPSFNYLMYDYFPLYNKFRTVEMTLVMAMVSMPLLGLLAAEKILQGTVADLDKKLLYAFGGVAALLVLVMVFAGLADFSSSAEANQPAWFVDALHDQRQAMMRGDAFRSLLFIAAAFALLYFYRKNKVSYPLLSGGLILLVALDLGLVDKRFLNADNYERNPARALVTPTEADQYVLNQRKPKDRVLNLQVSPFQDGTTSYFHSSIGGYHGAKLKRYQDLVDRQLSPEISTMIQNLQQGQRNFSDVESLNMLNTRFILAGPTQNAVIENPQAYGSAWLVSNVAQVDTPDEEIAALDSVNLRTTAVVDVSKFPSVENSYSASGTIQLQSADPNELVYAANVPAKSLAVFSEIYYPVGWTATVDDQEVPILRANYVLRALEIPEGQHTIRLRFAPQSYYVGNTVSTVASILLTLVVLGAVGWTAKEELTT